MHAPALTRVPWVTLRWAAATDLHHQPAEPLCYIYRITVGLKELLGIDLMREML